MKKYKVIYYVGAIPTLKTKVQIGYVIIQKESFKLVTKNNEFVSFLDNTKDVELFMHNNIGSMIKLTLDKEALFLSVVRFCISSQFAIINRSATRKLEELLNVKR